MPRVTMKDVAFAAGVSITTVSHVINKTRRVRQATRERVEEAMHALGYQPSSVARSLRMGVTKTIGLILPDVSNPFFAEISRQIEDFGYQQGYSVILCNSDNNLQKQHEYVNTLLAKQVDGIIFISAGESLEDLSRLSASGIPVVVADRDVPLHLADVVMLDNEKAGYKAAQHLISLGHRHIACITGPSHLSPSMLRVAGYQRALQQAGIKYPPETIVRGDFRISGGEQAMRKLLNLMPAPTAVFALNDMMALGAISALRSAGLRVPQDVSVVGFDDIMIAALVDPPLTTISQPIKEIAEWATNMLIEKMHVRDADCENRRIVLDAELIVRQSTQQMDTHHE
ncbi:MAG: LacI family transcriptional regulator [Chloroflexi bacterium]|nr:LacI family transcriptional regulator [Chloroflexota bacterium]